MRRIRSIKNLFFTTSTSRARSGHLVYLHQIQIPQNSNCFFPTNQHNPKNRYRNPIPFIHISHNLKRRQCLPSPQHRPHTHHPRPPRTIPLSPLHQPSRAPPLSQLPNFPPHPDYASPPSSFSAAPRPPLLSSLAPRQRSAGRPASTE